ncbi:NAD(P)H-dependent glycerol-3-phosphate dehydrogenase [Marinoscillum furvescens]|uniref:Glycerol-3-phosphate dehydrogenase [NAD(P)+] n=1 Tax=Marinoscillum furvescens DSM 4134 TaxID=1122208 RepID=A0A3D9L5B7_MARFU|nr:NAD(P)H-dependent glycerol-3-phosphate dehydrogenase [Marinoscillum furvescens]REE01192.1 glycerol-3-phosphate dehydrogenase (NAD(P)+) [Marinoscillum furvescens DSM 4134]
MGSKNTSETPVGVIGAGSFGTAVSNILAEKNKRVLLYARSAEKVATINASRECAGHKIHDHIEVTNDLEYVGQSCNVIFPVVPSANFRSMMKELAPYLRPYHILIHGTKGFDLNIDRKKIDEQNPLSREHVRTMSEVIKEESSVVRVGCLAGPNLAREISDKKPAATVVASHFDEVIRVGQNLLRNDRFLIYGSNDLIGIELCGILKNIIAVGAGTIAGLELGENAKALFISRGLVEMVHIGKALGGNAQAFLSLAGVGDLMATSYSNLSRNFTVGNRLAKGETIDEIIASMEEVAEGVKTIEIINELAQTYGVRCPITETLHRVIKKEMTVNEAHRYLMKFPFRAEIDIV